MIVNLLITVAIFAGIYVLEGWKAIGIGVVVYLIVGMWMRNRRERRKWPFSGRYEPERHDPFSHRR